MEMYENQRKLMKIQCKIGNPLKIKGELFKNSRNVEFLGWINREEAIKVANNSHLAIAPYQNMINYELNLVNKYMLKTLFNLMPRLRSNPLYCKNKISVA